MVSRAWRVALVLCLTVLLAVPLYQLSTDAESEYAYAQEASQFYHHVSGYFTSSSTGDVHNNTLYGDGTRQEVQPQFNFSSACHDFPDTEGILFLMKTGATESFDRLPTQLLTTMSCLPDFLIFSDLEQQIGKFHIYNVLDRVDEIIRQTQPEFDLYEAEQRCPVSQKDCTADMIGGWDLDKYKFLNMAVRTWEMRPGMKWYVFAESDTYIFWPGMVSWLRNHAPGGESYIGSVALLNDMPFAHGGSGYVLSGDLMRRMVNDLPDLAARYDERATQECCGDFLMSVAVREAGTKVLQAHPMFNGEKPNTLPFGPSQWCQPLLSMHHVDAEEISMLWQYEETRANKSDVTQIKDIYHAFVEPHLVTRRRDWDNLADEVCLVGPSPGEQEGPGDEERYRQKPEEEKTVVETEAHQSPDACARVCEAEGLAVDEAMYRSLVDDDDKARYIRQLYEERIHDHDGGIQFRQQRTCFQWRYHHGACCTASGIKLGSPSYEEEDADKWTSGWFTRGIDDWIDARGECVQVEWQEPF
ncbi:hypothetical protein GMORB2_1032 [Geosmithia morbida]|uniref:Glycosyltransferase family 31 protein n=1 Tax=Geosmithia morbida TaxID=1094350 RepID=A0A9P4Z1N9_9HYPO|nr:uncharacterized protein GMORB2_1032 [Geosmithia morbida]KAF4125786.1 hypothetical protein GMORB2_1032 [Geosmithia morbida]